jgi:hypothetical protein
MTTLPLITGMTRRILDELAQRRGRSPNGVRDMPDGTAVGDDDLMAAGSAASVQELAESGELTWRDLFEAKVYAVLGESNPARLRDALLDVLDVGTEWAERLDNRLATALLAAAADTDPGNAEVLSLFQEEHHG